MENCDSVVDVGVGALYRTEAVGYCIAHNVGQAVQNVRNIGSTVNAMSGGRIGSSPFGQKMQEITNKVESGANFIANNEGRAQGAINDISIKIKA